MTPGACGETADGMSEAMIDQIIELMRFERYRFAPAAGWATPGILEALIPGRMQGHGGTEEIPG